MANSSLVANSSISKPKRAVPLIGSIPIRAKLIPTRAAIMPRNTYFPISAKNSGGPNFRASLASGEPINAKPIRVIIRHFLLFKKIRIYMVKENRNKLLSSVFMTINFGTMLCLNYSETKFWCQYKISMLKVNTTNLLIYEILYAFSYIIG